MVLGGNRPGVVMNSFKISLCILICAFSCMAYGCGSEKGSPTSQKQDKSATSDKPQVVEILPTTPSAGPSQALTAPAPSPDSSPPPPGFPTPPPAAAGPPPGFPTQPPAAAGPPPGFTAPPSAGPPPSPDATSLPPPPAQPPASKPTPPKAKAGQLDETAR